MDVEAVLTPQQRLAASRRALALQLHGRAGEPEHDAVPPLEDGYAAAGYEAAWHDDPAAMSGKRRGLLDRFVWGGVAKSVATRWWRRHPANAMGQLARPLLDRYARKEPLKLMGAAAGVGALVVLIKPWRLLSITAVLAAVLKTSDVADMVTTLMQNNTSPRKDPPP